MIKYSTTEGSIHKVVFVAEFKHRAGDDPFDDGTKPEFERTEAQAPIQLPRSIYFPAASFVRTELAMTVDLFRAEFYPHKEINVHLNNI